MFSICFLLQGLSGNSLYAVPDLPLWKEELSIMEFPHEQLKHIEKLGEGQFGEVSGIFHFASPRHWIMLMSKEYWKIQNWHESVFWLFVLLFQFIYRLLNKTILLVGSPVWGSSDHRLPRRWLPSEQNWYKPVAAGRRQNTKTTGLRTGQVMSSSNYPAFI